MALGDVRGGWAAQMGVGPAQRGVMPLPGLGSLPSAPLEVDAASEESGWFPQQRRKQGGTPSRVMLVTLLLLRIGTISRRHRFPNVRVMRIIWG